MSVELCWCKPLPLLTHNPSVLWRPWSWDLWTNWSVTMQSVFLLTKWCCDGVSQSSLPIILSSIFISTRPAPSFLFHTNQTHVEKGTTVLFLLCIYWCYFPFLFNCVVDCRRSCCCGSVGVVRITDASLKRKKSQSRAVTVKCCRSPCDLEHRNINCTFSIFIFDFASFTRSFCVFLTNTFPHFN